MVMRARGLLQENELDTNSAFRSADPSVLDALRATLLPAVELGYFPAVMLNSELAELGFDLTEADAIARAAAAQDRRTKTAIRSAMITAFHEGCTSAEMRAASAASGGLFEGIAIDTGCRLQNSFGFYADLGFSDVRLLGCSDDNCR